MIAAAGLAFRWGWLKHEPALGGPVLSEFEDPPASVQSARGGSASASPFEELVEAPESTPEPAHDESEGRPIGWRRQVETSADFSVETQGEAWEYWFQAVVGVAFAGGAYGLPAFIIGGFIGFLIAGFFAVSLVVPFAMAVRAICGTWRHPLAAPCFGGLIGYVSIAAWTPLVIESRWDMKLFAIGPMLATLVGQSGGYLATRHAALEMIVLRQRRPATKWWQFSIGAVLIGTASVAVLLTLLRMWWRPLEVRELYALALWLPWQVALLGGFAWLGKRSARKRREATSRFT